MKQSLLLSTALLTLVIFVNAQNSSPYWSLAGNSNALSSSKLGTTNATNLIFFTNNLERMRLTSAGDIGVGTSSLSAKFTINSASGSNPLKVQVNGSSKLFVSSAGGVSVGSSSTPPANGLYVSGNAGIGTTTPSAKLEVVGSSANGSTGIIVSGTGYGIQASSPGFGVSGKSGNIGVYAEGGYAGLSAYGGGSGSYGVLAYGQTYGVYGSAPTYGVYGTGNEGVYAVSNTASGDGVRSVVSGSSNFAINAYSASSIGVYGSTGNSSSFAGYFAGNVYCTATYSGSDAKLKKNITTVDNAMNIINQLQPKNYEYRDDGDFAKMNLPIGKHYGFIAQDLEKVLPNLVKQTQFSTAKSDIIKTTAPVTPQIGANGVPAKPELVEPVKEVKGETIDFKAVNYIEIIPIVVKAMQEQDAKLKADEAKMQEQQAKIDDLKTEINELKSLISKNINSSVLSPSGGYLKQNTPNPSNNNTVISYYTPDNTRNAQIVITDMKGSVLKAYNVTRGQGQVNVSNDELPAGTYNYTLFVNSGKIDTKQMVVIK